MNWSSYISDAYQLICSKTYVSTSSVNTDIKIDLSVLL